ncbi:MAG: hypothetical protein HY692_09250, partial [Cyanobacteria bacterium NC_groundwater_1444_Ag_S-0.65um_54_12]|nr:hypothetical protein [Cyanobacteria bacterium NC_groundwater_1444_Ag_S-0.65um_54_12]
AHASILEQQNLTIQETPDPDLAYIFKHVITQEVVYGLLPYSSRKALHQTAAEWYERTGAADLPQFYPLLAHHWGNTAVAAKALDYLIKAGEHCLNSYANQEAVHSLGKALRFTQSSGYGKERLMQARLERLLAKAYFGMGRMAESREHFEHALALLGNPVPATRLKLVGALLRQLTVQLWRRSRAKHGFETAIPLATVKKVEWSEQIHSSEYLAEVYFFANDALATLYAAISTLNLAERLGPSPELARAYATMCYAAGLGRLHSLARTYQRRSWQVSAILDNPLVAASTCIRTGMYELGIGKLASARKTFEQAVTISEQFGDRRQWGESLPVVAVCCFFQGEFQQGLELYRRLHAGGQHAGNLQQQVWGLNGQSMGHYRLGKASELTRTLKSVESVLAASKDRIQIILHKGLAALNLARQGDWEQVSEALQEWLGMINAAPTNPAIIDGYSGAAEACFALWEKTREQRSAGLPTSETIAKIAKRICHVTKNYAAAYELGKPYFWLYRGSYEWFSGKKAQAHRAWQKSLMASQALDIPYEQGLAHYEIGRHLPAPAPARQSHLARAHEIFTRLGAAHYLEQLDKLPDRAVISSLVEIGRTPL